MLKINYFCLCANIYSDEHVKHHVLHNKHILVCHFQKKKKGTKKSTLQTFFLDIKQDRKTNEKKKKPKQKENLITFLEMHAHTHYFSSFNSYCAVWICMWYFFLTLGRIGQDMRKEFSPEHF